MRFGYIIGFKLIDRGVLEYFGSFGIANLYSNICLFHKIYSGYVYHYIFILWLFIMLILFSVYYLTGAVLTFYFFFGVCYLIFYNE